MDDQERIKSIRASTREIVQQLGYLNNLFAHIGSVSQCYALHKLEDRALTLHDLSVELGLERSTVSRLAKDLVGKGYCAYLSNDQDGRSRFLQLTELGKKQLAEIHTLATAQVKTALSKMTEAEQDSVTKSLSLYAEALKND